MELSIWQYIVGSIILLLAIVLVIFISKQQGKRKGLENVISGQSSSNSYLNRTEAAKKGKRFEKWTLILAIVFGVLVIALYTITAISENIKDSEKSQVTSSQQVTGSTSSEASK